MRLVTLDEKVKHRGVIRLHHITDLHAGAPDFDEEAFLERRLLIEQDPGARWTMGGDGGDLIRHNDPRYELSSLAVRYRKATDIRHATREHLAELFDPIKEKCWGWADGNHERAMDKHYGGHFGVEVCCDLGIEDRWVDYRGLIRVKVECGGRGTFLPLLIDLQHGWQVGRLKGAPAVQAERELGMTDADIVLRGHNHQPYGQSFRTLSVSGGGRGQILTRPRTVINGGTWRRGYVDLAPVNADRLSEVEKAQWGETKGFRPEMVGGPVLLLTFDEGRGRTSGRKDVKNHGARGASGALRAATIEHTIISDSITEQTLGLAA